MHSKSITAQHGKKINVELGENAIFLTEITTYFFVWVKNKFVTTKQTLSKDFLTSIEPRCVTQHYRPLRPGQYQLYFHKTTDGKLNWSVERSRSHLFAVKVFRRVLSVVCLGFHTM